MKLFFLPLFILLVAPASFGCICAGTTVQKSFKEASAILSGKYIRSEYRKGIKSEFEEKQAEFTGKKQDYEVLVYIFEADLWWKGPGTREVVLITDQTRRSDGTESVSDCGLGFRPDIKYLIYAYGEGDDFGTGFCTLTKQMAKAANDLRILTKLARPVPAQ
jgi:hypothetical protein